MLFLKKTTIISVLCLGILFSVTPKAHSLEGRELLGLAAAAATVYATAVHKVDNASDKNVLMRAVNKSASLLQKAANLITSRETIGGVILAGGAYALVVHGKNAKDTVAVKALVNLVNRVPAIT